MLKRSSSALKTWVVMGVGALVLALSAFFVLSNYSPDSTFAQQAQTPGLIMYAENGEGPVRVFTSEDPEDAGIHWDVTGTDADDFSISGGVLTFNKPPNFESHTDRPHRDLDFNGDGDTADPGEAATTTAADGMYQITIRASEMRSGGSGLALSTESHVTVEVTNVNEPGTVTIDRIQPEVGTQLTASLDDEDTDGTTIVAWRWYVSTVTNPLANAETHWRAISDDDGGNAQTYTPSGTRVGDIATNTTPDTAGKYLRAVATYTDSLSAERTPSGVTDNPVRAEVPSSSDSGVTNPANGSPGFTQGVDYTRTVSESLAKGMNVGAPVVAKDPQNTLANPNNDELTYELDDDADDTNAVVTTGDVGYFSIDKATGQIMVEKALDYDNNPDRKYEFYVRAYDPSGEDAEVMVTVNVTDANDAPQIMGSVAPPGTDVPDAPAELRVNEEDSDTGATAYDGMPGLVTTLAMGNSNVFTAPDEDERGQITWTLEGDDKDAFVLTQTGLTGSDEPVAVVFDNPPDYENPTDTNGDSVYKVTLVATDSTSLPGSSPLRDERTLTVFVDNVHEMGEVTMVSSGSDSAQPHIGDAINAEVTDPDGGVAVVTWQWQKGVYDDTTNAVVYTVIPGATSSSYTPVQDDDGATLRVIATYIDMTSDMDDSATATADERVQTAAGEAKTAETDDGSVAATPTKLYRVTATSENAVRVAPDDPTATDDPAFEMAAYDRTVAENAETGSLVGEPVMVNAETDVTFQYDLNATVTNDNNYFTIDDYGQIRVGSVAFPNPLPAGVEALPTGATAPTTDDPALDYEGASNTFSLVVTATDMEDTSRSATTRVTVTLEDLNEAPYFDKPSRVAVGTEAAPITYIESRTNAVVELEAVEPDGDSLHWETVGTDGPDFEIRQLSDIPGSGKDRVALHFKSQPDFENGKGSVTNEPNQYRVTVRATETSAVGDGPNLAAELPVFVTVGNADEDGKVDISLLQPEEGTNLTATVSDPDGVATVSAWTWWRSKVSNPVQDETDSTDSTFVASWELIRGATNPYAPVAADVGKYLLARAEYTDPQSADLKAAVARTAVTVRANVADADNNSPDFTAATDTRTIAENAAVGTNVGIPVVVDVNEDQDLLTYVLDDDGGEISDGTINTVTVADDTDATFFSIDKRSGQITVAKKLDFDAKPTTANPDGEYVVWVRAFDSSGEGSGENNDRIQVTITATDVNDAPRITGGNAEISVNEVDSTKKPSDNGQYFIGLGNTADLNTAPYTVTENANEENLYRRTDEDKVESGKWPEPIGGPDGSHFEYSTPVGESDIGRRLHFKKSNLPDYEKPMDANGDNVYEVTIRVLDNAGAAGTKDVRITVTNVNEAGKLVLTPEQPDAGMPVVATLTDPDGVTSITNWRWAIADGTVDDFAAAVALDADGVDGDGLGEVAGATTFQYMAAEGKFAWALVEYRDGASTVNHPVTALDERNDDPGTTDTIETNGDSDEKEEAVTDNAVEPDPDTTTGPEVPSAETIEIERMVYENVPSTGYVGIPLDSNAHIDYISNGDTASRDTIAGPDAATFVFAEENDATGSTFYDVDLAPTDDIVDKKGQLAAAVVTHFDYETKPSYIIEVRDPDAEVTVGAVRVTINVVNVNEAPSAPTELRVALAITGPPSVDVYEVTDPAGTAPEVGTYNTLGVDASSSTWTLSGDDAADFSITPGPGAMATVTFAAVPDYENGADMDADSVYEFTVEANDGTNTATRDVTVTVKNMDDMGRVMLDPMMAPQVGEPITATLEDEDGSITGLTWKWQKDDAQGEYTDVATQPVDDPATTNVDESAIYVPVMADEGSHIQAVAMYDDGHAEDKMAMGHTDDPVGAIPSTGSDLGDHYDSTANGGNENGLVDTMELLRAVRDYFAAGSNITVAEMLELVRIYFAS